MKYKAQQTSDGQWAVFTGVRYFPLTVTENQKDAEKRAYIMSMQWYQQQMTDVWYKGLEEGHFGEYENMVDYLS